MMDFNNPISGKEVIYDIKVLRKLEKTDEKIKSFINFLFRKDLPFEIKSDKIVIEVEQAMAQFVKLFEEKFKDLFGMGLEVKETAQQATQAVQEAVGKENLEKTEDISEQANPSE
jgi:hypothetical protein